MQLFLTKGSFTDTLKDEENRLRNLFWAGMVGLGADYARFGDVIAFDATYRTNSYRKLFVIIVSVKHHHQTTIFGCASLTDEKVETYSWLLTTFLEAMAVHWLDIKPVSVLTKGDKAMRNAIKSCFPNSIHRLCS